MRPRPTHPARPLRAASVLAAGLIAAGILSTLSPASAQTQPAPATAAGEDFQACLARLQDQARARDLPPAIVDEVIPGMQQQARVLELDRRQPEFMQTFGRYLALRVTDTRIEQGREKLAEHADLLASLRERYGVPGHYLVAFWGLETNYGGYLGTMPTLDSLATLACDPRRSDYFTGEFLTALELMERENLTPAQMQGSWAGAMGHTQFMPSAYWQYALDGDGDERADLWRSETDALTSAAHFLNRLGWEPDLRWGREVLLPNNFDYLQAGSGAWRPLADWSADGLRRTDGRPLPAADVDAMLLVPAGADGPAFLVYRNFEVIMRWNRSESYAISVGLLADRIAGAGGLNRPPPNDEALRVSEVEAIQATLAARGYDPGPADGIWGPATRRALAAFEQDSGRVADGYPDPDTVNTLLAADD
jgi:membrane-bound lytic murein transglycosylase B